MSEVRRRKKSEWNTADVVGRMLFVLLESCTDYYGDEDKPCEGLLLHTRPSEQRDRDVWDQINVACPSSCGDQPS